MLCPKCNSEMSENGVCPVCSAAETESTARVALPTSRISKRVYLSSYASQKAKTSSLVVRILAAACAFMFLLGGFLTLNMSVFDIPIIDLVMPEDVEWENEGDSLIRETKDLLDQYEDEVSDDEFKVMEKFLKKAEKFADKPSISNIKGLAKASVAIADIDEIGVSDVDLDILEDELMSVFDVIYGVVWTVAIILALFALLSGLTFNPGWIITAMIINVITSLVFVGFWFFILVTAIIIVLLVFNKKFKDEFKSFNYIIENNLAR